MSQGLTVESFKWAWFYHLGNWHPLTWLSHMVDCELFGPWVRVGNKSQTGLLIAPFKPDFGPWAGGHHLVNVAIHAAAAVLLFWTIRLMTGAFWPAAMVAALFAIHPLRVESVAWAAERKDTLCAVVLDSHHVGVRLVRAAAEPRRLPRGVGVPDVGDHVEVDGRRPALRD